jgi:hypothetical protein
MAQFRITDTAIKADYGMVEASDSTDALNRYARLMNWDSYADFLAVGIRFTGIGALTAEPARTLAEVA